MVMRACNRKLDLTSGQSVEQTQAINLQPVLSEESQMADKVYEPKFMLWCEQQFASDVVVRRMTPYQRLMFRSLLQTAFWCSTRPDLPDDDEQLCDLADADSLEHWMANKSAVLRKFTLENGVWSNKRLRADWNDRESGYQQKIDAAGKGGRARADNAKRNIETAKYLPSENQSNIIQPPATSQATAKQTLSDRLSESQVKDITHNSELTIQNSKVRIELNGLNETTLLDPNLDRELETTEDNDKIKGKDSGSTPNPQVSIASSSNGDEIPESIPDPVAYLISEMYCLLGEPRKWISSPAYMKTLKQDAKKSLDAGTVHEVVSALRLMFKADNPLSEEFLERIISANNPMAMFAACSNDILLKAAALERKEKFKTTRPDTRPQSITPEVNGRDTKTNPFAEWKP